MTTTMTYTARFADLPAALKTLAKLAPVRPSTVKVELQVGTGALIATSWRRSAASNYPVISSVEDHWTGSDGEMNVTYKTTYAGPAVEWSTKCGRAKSTLTIVLPVDEATFQRTMMLTAETKEGYSYVRRLTAERLAILVDESLTVTGNAPAALQAPAKAKAPRKAAPVVAPAPVSNAHVEMLAQLGID